MYAFAPASDWPKYQYTGLSTNGQLHHGYADGGGGESGPVRRDDEVPPGDDEQRDVDVVHPDARLGEHRPVGDDRDADEGRDEPRREEAPRQEHEDEGEDRRGHDAGQPPGER